MQKTITLTLLLLAALSGTLLAQRAIEFEGRYWMPQTHSRIRLDSAGSGTDIDFKNDLGMADKKFPQGRFTYQGKGRSRLRFTYTPIEYNGDAVVSRTLTFGGQSYTAGTRVISDIRIQHLQLGWAYQFVNVHNGVFKLGTLIEAHGFLMKSRLRGPNLQPPVDKQESASVGLPTVGLAMDINPHRMVNIFAELSGLKLGKYGYFLNSDFGVKIRPASNVFFTAGYRNFNLNVKNSPDFARVELRGPFVGGGVRF